MNIRKIKSASALLAAFGLLAVNLPAYTQQAAPTRKVQANTQSDEGPAKNRSPRTGLMNSEEKVVRDVYARLMRYHTAARDEQAATTGVSYKPEDYVVFELRNIHTGPIDEIAVRALADLVTEPTEEMLSVTAHHLQYGNGPKHSCYDVAWGSSPSTTYNDKLIVTEMLASGGDRLVDIVRYTSFEVTIRLAGKERTYRAIALHHNGADTNGKIRTEILDNVTAEINVVLADASPRVRSPWAKYVKSSLYLQVAKQVSTRERAGEPLIPVDAPIGYLPGDDAANGGEMQVSVGCVATINIKWNGTVITDTTQSVWVGQKVALEADIQPAGASVTNPQWTIPGKVIQNYTADGNAGTVTALTVLTNLSLAYYWVDGGDGREIQFSAKVNDQLVSAKATFNVARPTSTVTTSTGTITVRNEEGKCWCRLGNPNTHGIDFSRTMQQGYNGTTCWAQIATPSAWFKDVDNKCWQLKGPGLDTQFPYGSDPAEQDSPAVSLDDTIVRQTVDDQFDMWLLYKPAGNDSIWIPLKKIHWSWTADATRNGTGCNAWHITSSAVGAVTVVDSLDHPTWTKKANLTTYKKVACN